MPQVKAALYEIFTVAALAAAAVAMLKGIGVSIPALGGSVIDFVVPRGGIEPPTP